MADILKIYNRKIQTLHTLAEKDDGYLMWQHICEKEKAKFDKLMRFLPAKARHTILCYIDAEVCRVNYVKGLALRHMEFSPKILAECPPEKE